MRVAIVGALMLAANSASGAETIDFSCASLNLSTNETDAYTFRYDSFAQPATLRFVGNIVAQTEILSASDVQIIARLQMTRPAGDSYVVTFNINRITGGFSASYGPISKGSLPFVETGSCSRLKRPAL